MLAYRIEFLSAVWVDAAFHDSALNFACRLVFSRSTTLAALAPVPRATMPVAPPVMAGYVLKRAWMASWIFFRSALTSSTSGFPLSLGLYTHITSEKTRHVKNTWAFFAGEFPAFHSISACSHAFQSA